MQPDESFLAYRYCDVDFLMPYHFHPEVEVVGIELGGGTRIVGDHVGSFASGELCLFGAGLPHCFHLDQGNSGAISWVLQFRQELLQSLLELPEMIPLKRLLEHGNLGLRFSKNVAAEATLLLQHLTRVSARNRFAVLLELLSTLSTDFSAKTLASPGYAPRASVPSGRRMQKAWDIILQDYDKDISQAQIALDLGMSVSALSRLFRRMTGNTFRRTLIDLRLGKACRLLLSDDDLSIAQACFDSGFNHLSIFNRHFKSRYGINPREWRKRQGKSSVR